MEPLLGFGGPLLAVRPTPGYYDQTHAGDLCRDDAVVVIDAQADRQDKTHLLIVDGRGRCRFVQAEDVVIANPAGPSWSPEWIGEMTALRQAKS